MFTMSLEAEGLHEMMSTLRTIEQIAGGRHYTGSELTSKTRESVSSGSRLIMSGGMTNAQVLSWLAEGGRDFRNPGGREDEIGRSFVKKSIEAIPRKKVMRGYTGSKGAASLVKALAKRLDKDAAKVAKNLASGGYRAAMKEYMKIVSDNIDKGKFEGGGSKDLNEQYAVFKKLHFGFEKPIGKASGQITDAINPKGPSSRNIKLIRGRVKK